MEEGEVNQFFNFKVYNYKRHVQNQEKRRKRLQQENEQNFGDNNINIKGDNDTGDININVECSNDQQETNYSHTTSKKKKKRKNISADPQSKEIEKVEVKSIKKTHKHVGNELNDTDIFAKTVKRKKKKKNSDISNDRQDTVLDNKLKTKESWTSEVAIERNEIGGKEDTLSGDSHAQDFIKPVKCKKKKNKYVSSEINAEAYSEYNIEENIEKVNNKIPEEEQGSVTETIRHKKKKRDKGLPESNLSVEPKETMCMVAANEENGNKNKKKKYNTENEIIDHGLENSGEVVKHKKKKRDKYLLAQNVADDVTVEHKKKKSRKKVITDSEDNTEKLI